MKCRVHKCGAMCCYNIPFEENELERFAEKIVNPVINTEPIGDAVLAYTDLDMDKNKCPFLRFDCKCNIYENRPRVCRLFGCIDALPCKFLKK